MLWWSALSRNTIVGSSKSARPQPCSPTSAGETLGSGRLRKRGKLPVRCGALAMGKPYRLMQFFEHLKERSEERRVGKEGRQGWALGEERQRRREQVVEVRAEEALGSE